MAPQGSSEQFEGSRKSEAESQSSQLSADTWSKMFPDSYLKPENHIGPTPQALDFSGDIYGAKATPTEKDPSNKDVCPKDDTAGRGRGMVNATDFLENAKKMYDRIDSDRDGFLTDAELEMALRQPCLTADDRKTIEILRKRLDSLEELSNDERGDEDDGITRDDLQEFGEVIRTHKRAMAYEKLAKEKFDVIDKDRDGFIDRGELEEAYLSNNPVLSREDRATIEEMRREFSSIEDVSNDEWGPENDGITKDDLKGYNMDKLDANEWGVSSGISGDLLRHTLDKEDRWYEGFKRRQEELELRNH